jgi:Zn finger protein HypA/HybF involved in hydrogenase expression
MTQEKDQPVRKKNPQAGKCPKCYVQYLSTENGYYCPQCGDMGWFTWDDYFDE